MTAPTPGPAQTSAPSRTRRFVLWLVVFGAIVIGVALAFIYGPRVTPFLDVSR
ncbi:MAG TPA: hypothetical protein VJ717_14405 [Gemmatimonadaceae bacterium]|nr:hypothetical protein [Gemmatimonadaceae bacterium]